MEGRDKQMKVALEIGEALDVVLVEGDKLVGTLSLSLRGVGSGSGRGRSAGAGTSSEASSKEPGLTKTGRRRRTLSPEARAKMAEAQRRRWAKTRGGSE